MQSLFEVVVEPNRRAILGALAGGERTVSELERRLELSQPSVSKHLRVLREAGFVEARTDAQRRVYRLRAERLRPLDAWLAPYRRLWERSLDALERHLDGVPGPSFERPRAPRKRLPRTRTP